MSMLKNLGLPPVTDPLKSISPFILRADELKSKEPIMAYWCAYYAAQLGIALKAKDTPSRNFLFSLLSVLELLKREIGPNDAVDIESVSVAFVENFALRVFAMADNEDRAGKATRSTAKKFLAASNFLEVLKIFPQIDISESNEEKIKYAKWKAADIAKAIRDGRQPTPGPSSQPLPSTAPLNITASPPSPPTHNKSSPPTMQAADIARANSSTRNPNNLGVTVHDGNSLDSVGATPGSWSTAATPGVTLPTGGATPGSWSTAATPGAWTTVGTPESGAFAPAPPKAWVSEELEGLEDDMLQPPKKAFYIAPSKLGNQPETYAHTHSGSSGSDGAMGRGHTRARSGSSAGPGGVSGVGRVRSGSASGANQEDPRRTRKLSASSAQQPRRDRSGSAGSHTLRHHDRSISLSGSAAAGVPFAPSNTSVSSNGLPLGFVPNGPSPAASDPSLLHGVDESMLPRGFIPLSVTPPPPPVIYASLSNSSPPYGISPPSVQYTPSAPPPPPPIVHYAASAPPPPPSVSHYSPPAPVIQYTPPTAVPQPEVELSPKIIAKAQKHCRFAISALDYEDAEQARRELRAALDILGG